MGPLGGSRGIQNMKHEFLCFPSLLASFPFIFKNKRIVFVGDVLFYGVRPNKPNHHWIRSSSETLKRRVNRGMQIHRSVLFFCPIRWSDVIFTPITLKISLVYNVGCMWIYIFVLYFPYLSLPVYVSMTNRSNNCSMLSKIVLLQSNPQGCIFVLAHELDDVERPP